MNAINELEKLGYTFTLEGDKIRYQHNGALVENEELVKSLLAELKVNKSEAIRFLLDRQLMAVPNEKRIKPEQQETIDFCHKRIAYFTPLANGCGSSSWRELWQSQLDYYRGILASMN